VPQATSRTYSRPPITEAIIDIRIAAAVTDVDQKKVVERLKRRYPHSQPTHEVSINFTGFALGVTQSAAGYRVTTDEQTDVVLVMPQGLATARLAPYQGWPLLRDHARKAWEAWRQETPHQPVSRIGIRYINRLDVPVDNRAVIRIEDYLTLYPHLPAIDARPMLGYMMETVIPLSAPDWVATVRSALLTPPPIPKYVSLLLDFDVFRTADLPRKEDDLWHLVETGRDIKNGIFEACITDEARKLFNDE